MKAIKIDAKLRVVSEVEIDEKDSLHGMQEIVGGLIEHAHEVKEGEDLFVNEEGLLLGFEDFFEYEGAHQPFAGNGVIVGADAEGNSVGSKLSLADVIEKVKFLNLAEVRAKI